jgi:uncharacterized SAM-binding protein YcdF (DUF218 family)
MAKSRRRLLYFLFIAGVLCGTSYILRKPIFNAIGDFLVVSDSLQKADAIAVLCGNGVLRGRAAADLYLQGLAPRILITREDYLYRSEELARYGIHVLEEHEIVLEVLRYMKVPQECVSVLDGYNESTVAEARRYLDYMQCHRLNRLIVVTSNFHSRRSRLIFRRIFRGSDITVMIHPGPPSFEFNPDGWWTRRENYRNLLFEYQKLFFYSLRYW